MSYSSIEAFDRIAKEKCPCLFKGEYESYPAYLKRTGRKYEHVRYLAGRKQNEHHPENYYIPFIYHLEEERSTNMVYAMLERCEYTVFVFCSIMESETLATTRICYYWDTSYGMYLIMANANRMGMISDMEVRVYTDLDQFLMDIMDLWSSVSRRFAQNPAMIADQKALLENLVFG